MREFKAKECKFTIVRQRPDCESTPCPWLRCADGANTMACVSPHHGRSFVVGRHDDGRFVVSKGNGLSYTQHAHLYSAEFGDNAWGLLLERDAIRDFDLGMEIAALGIKTNKMEYVLRLDEQVILTTGHIVYPILLQYSVECPYRICDAPYMHREEIEREVAKWDRFNDKGYDSPTMIAADVLVRNLRVLHDHEILHNAIHFQNYTWALELLDFELSCSPTHPYDDEQSNRVAKELYAREIIQTYEVINHIAGCLHEPIDYAKMDALFRNYGFDIDKFSYK